MYNKDKLKKEIVPYAVALCFLALVGVPTIIYLNAKGSQQRCIPKPIRMDGMGLVKPVLFTEFCEEDPEYQAIKDKIQKFISDEKAHNQLISATVYLRKLDDFNLMTINDSERYSPGSLMKVANLITYLKQAEQNPTILDKKILFPKTLKPVPNQTLFGPPLTPGKSYTVRKLLYFMIVNSNNQATSLLGSHIDFAILQRLFSDLKLPAPNKYQEDYLIKASEYSRFMRVLYNSSYLKPELSQYALHLLTKSTYEKGLITIFGDKIKIAHKFGERSYYGESELHEFGILYFKNENYLLGIMTKGKDRNLLAQTMTGIGKIIRDSIPDLQY